MQGDVPPPGSGDPTDIPAPICPLEIDKAVRSMRVSQIDGTRRVDEYELDREEFLSALALVNAFPATFATPADLKRASGAKDPVKAIRSISNRITAADPYIIRPRTPGRPRQATHPGWGLLPLIPRR